MSHAGAAPFRADGPAPVWAEAFDAAGALLGSVSVGHGQSPQQALARAGLQAGDVLGVGRGAGGRGIVLRYAARRATPGAAAVATRPVTRDPDLVLAAGERPVRVQRVAAYALVRSDRGVLLTQLSARTNAAGCWTLPGGGLDPGEDPEAALHREVAEETGQVLRVRSLQGVFDAHWVGRAPRGRVEDYHVLRLLYLADCPTPTDPVVHEVDGTTAAAAWIPAQALAELPVSATWRGVLTDWVGRSAAGS